MELPYRKRNRLEGCSYSEQGLYFITICTRDREEILGVVGDGVPYEHFNFKICIYVQKIMQQRIW